MILFGTATGVDAADGCCCFPVFGGLWGTLVAAIVGAKRGSWRPVMLSFALAALVGVMVVPPAVKHELHDTDDSRGVHAMLWQFVWWWAASLCAPLGGVIALVLRERVPDEGRLSNFAAEECSTDAVESGPTDMRAMPADPHGEPDRVRGEAIVFGPWVPRLLVLCLLLLPASLLAVLCR
jgi:hypothetical protein